MRKAFLSELHMKKTAVFEGRAKKKNVKYRCRGEANDLCRRTARQQEK